MNKITILKLFTVLLVAFLSIGCASGQHATEKHQVWLKTGSGSTEIVNALGKPDLIEKHNNGTQKWTYLDSDKTISKYPDFYPVLWSVYETDKSTNLFSLKAPSHFRVIAILDMNNTLSDLNWFTLYLN